MASIAKWITDWRVISPFLGITEAEEIAILGSSHSLSARKMMMLRKWKLKQGIKATYNRLCRVFRKSDLLDLAEKVKELLVKSNSSSDEEGMILREFYTLGMHAPEGYGTCFVSHSVCSWCTGLSVHFHDSTEVWADLNSVSISHDLTRGVFVLELYT